MNQVALHRPLLDHDVSCAEFLRMAQRELGAFFRAVSELFGPGEAEVSAEDWLREVEAGGTLPVSAREWRQITVKVISQLADRVGHAAAVPVTAEVQQAIY